MSTKIKYQDLLKKLTKTELNKIVNLYHNYCEIYDYPIACQITKETKEEIINYLVDMQKNFLTFSISSLDETDFKILKKISKKKVLIVSNEFLKNFLTNNKLIINDTLANDIWEEMRKLVKSKRIKKQVKANSQIYLLSQGIITAYGVLKLDTFKSLLPDEASFNLVKLYPKKNFRVEKDKVVAQELKNKKKIAAYLKNKDLKEFSFKDFINLGNITYHHHNKNYQKLIKLIKSNYLFQKSDIMFLDKVIIIPYLYNNRAFENEALAMLNQNIDEYFEFASDKLKNKLITEIKLIKKEFPMWEYRGKSLCEVDL